MSNDLTSPHQWLDMRGRECLITMTMRPHYCDRGNYLALLDADAGSGLALDLDGQDLWPRYYFDLDRAKLECEAWLKKRGQWVEGATWKLCSEFSWLRQK